MSTHQTTASVMATWIFLLTVATPLSARDPDRRRSTLCLAQLSLGGRSSARSRAINDWARQVRARTSVHVTLKSPLVRPDSHRLFRYPLLTLLADGRFAKVTSKQVAHLRTHLGRGGMLLIDDTSRSGPSEALDRDVRSLVKRVLGKPLRRIPANDVLYRTFYRLQRPMGRRADFDHLEGVKLGKRWAVVYSRNDLVGAFRRDERGDFESPAVPGGQRQRERAWRLAINIVIYGLCLDYKDDHAHLDTLLRRKQRP